MIMIQEEMNDLENNIFLNTKQDNESYNVKEFNFIPSLELDNWIFINRFNDKGLINTN